MTTNELLKYVENHANDVSDLALVHSARTAEHADYRALCVKQLREKYEGEAETAQRTADFNEIMKD